MILKVTESTNQPINPPIITTPVNELKLFMSFRDNIIDDSHAKYIDIQEKIKVNIYVMLFLVNFKVIYFLLYFTTV